ncbi:MAG TPA: DUF3168 domain-containing protein [Alphaproteobacteria bacterium]|nr:DUF3168 domain-containing protein [Alphaproteobacteria bacterium]
MMTTETLSQVQVAVYSRLSGDSNITSRLATADAVYDHVPQGSAFPYIVISDMAAQPADTQQFAGMAVSMVLETYSRAADKQEIQHIAAAIESAFHHADFAVTGHHLVLCRITATDIAQVFDATTWLCRQRIALLVEPVET